MDDKKRIVSIRTMLMVFSSNKYASPRRLRCSAVRVNPLVSPDCPCVKPFRLKCRRGLWKRPRKTKSFVSIHCKNYYVNGLSGIRFLYLLDCCAQFS